MFPVDETLRCLTRVNGRDSTAKGHGCCAEDATPLYAAWHILEKGSKAEYGELGVGDLQRRDEGASCRSRFITKRLWRRCQPLNSRFLPRPRSPGYRCALGQGRIPEPVDLFTRSDASDAVAEAPGA